MQVREFQASQTEIEGLWVIQMKQVADERGTVREFYRQSAFRDAGLPDLGPWMQVNITESRRGAIRGLHGEEMHKLVGMSEGQAFGAYVDAREHSPSYGRVVTLDLAKGTQVLIPPGVCNGFQSTASHPSQYLYCFDAEWVPGMAGVAVNALDPSLAIDWPIAVDRHDRSQLSEKDLTLPALSRRPSAETGNY